MKKLGGNVSFFIYTYERSEHLFKTFVNISSKKSELRSLFIFKKFGLIVKIEKCFHKGHLTIFSRMRHFSRFNVHLSFLDFLIVKNLQSRSV